MVDKTQLRLSFLLLVVIGDLSALMDIIGTSVFLSSVLLIITIILNVTTLLIYRNKTKK